MKKRTAVILSIVAVLVFCLIYGMFDPAQTPFPRCPFFVLTGLKCPGCGSQRAIHQLLHLHIGQAFSYNALFVVLIPLMFLMLFAEIFAGRFPRLQRAAAGTVFSWSLLAIVLLWWLMRNIFGW